MSKIKKLGDDKTQKKSTYNVFHNNPKEQKNRYDYNKVNFNYQETYDKVPLNDTIWKKEDRNWRFDYWNKYQPQNYISIEKATKLPHPRSRLYDPVTDRYLKG